jgi:hypothetical protein
MQRLLLLEQILIGSLRVSCVKQVAYSVLQADFFTRTQHVRLVTEPATKNISAFTKKNRKG